MKKIILLFLSLLCIPFSCEKINEDSISEDPFIDEVSLSSDRRTTRGESSSSGSSSSENGGQPGLVTAAEWNDLNNWDFWNELLNEQEFAKMQDYWGIYTNNRIAVSLENNGVPIVDATVELLRNNAIIWTTKTDNLGFAEFLVSPYQKEENLDLTLFQLKVNGTTISKNVKLYNDGINTFNYTTNASNLNAVDISFIVDATGSMGDELDFLKADLQNVIEKVANENSSLAISTSCVFYRDKGDTYISNTSEFTTSLNETIAFIGKQNASGGGDFPEAVHTALDVAINDLQWSTNAKTRIAFLLLDAPPHYEKSVIQNIQRNLKKASKKGIKLIPISASGINKETEFLMRKMAILTNGTYLFITNDSGIGKNHLEASVGEYQVEKLNDLLVRLILKYSN